MVQLVFPQRYKAKPSIKPKDPLLSQPKDKPEHIAPAIR